MFCECTLKCILTFYRCCATTNRYLYTFLILLKSQSVESVLQKHVQKKLVRVQKITSQSRSSSELPMHTAFGFITKPQPKGMVNLYNETDWKGWFYFIIPWLTDSMGLCQAGKLQGACEKQDLNQMMSCGWFSLFFFSH